MNKFLEKLTIKQYAQLVDIVQDESIDEFEKVCRVLQFVYGKSEGEVNAMKLSEIDLSLIDIRLPDDLPIPFEVVIEGNRYKVTRDLKDLTFGQFVDLQVALGEVKDGKIHKHIGSIAKCFLTDFDGRYMYDLNVDNMRLLDAYPILLFFYRFRKQLEIITRRYLERTEKRAIKRISQMLR